ncbi:MAG TPA: Rne/Rng family ribonuclease [Verrucomicrobiales bacterium]|nr:Rne/Rng family ribonuclease [Verrucomicrobiales bacterium]
MLKRIKRIFGLEELRGGNKIIVNVEKLERRVALLENGVLEEYTIERVGQRNIVGSIFKGKVKNIEPGLKAMFVDIGLEKNAFLHFWDAIPAALDAGLEEIQRDPGKRKGQKRISSKDIPEIYPVGSEVLVQVTKGPIGNKGPRVTTNISLPGRFMVLMPLNDQFGISRKIEDPNERKRLQRITEKLSVPEGMGIIMRTVCQGKRARFFVRDLGILLDQWRLIDEKQAAHPAPLRVFEEPDVVERTVRDFLTEEIDEVLCDDPGTAERMRELAGAISRRARKRIRVFEGNVPVFERFGIQKQIDNAFHRQVWLNCGGYLVIDETEAMITIDVNTGRNKGSKDVDKMILETNLEAAEEVSRQLRLRNIGGLVVVDFIDMRSRRDQQAVYRGMKDRLKRDKAKTQILPISQLGLMEMTRQRLNESLSEAVYDLCGYCNGRGRVKSTMTMSVELQRRVAKILQRFPEDTHHDLLLVVHPDVLNRLRSEDDQILVELERRFSARLTFRSDPAFHRENVAVLDAKTGEEVRE